MDDRLKKVFLVIIVSVPIIILGWFGIAIYQIGEGWNLISEETWQIEKQMLIEEHFSPDSTKKIGFYKYDSGALGYTAIQMSVIDASATYPLGGNILMINRIPPTVKWKTQDSVFVVIDKSNTPGFTIDSTLTIEEIYFEFEIFASDSTYLKQYVN